MSVLTLGCRVNQYESDSFEESLERRGVRIVPFGEKCDLAIVNTCTVTAESDRKSRQMIRRAASNARHTVVTGCFAQISPDCFADDERVTFITGNSGKATLADKVYEILTGSYCGDKVNVAPPDDFGAVTMTLGTPMRSRSYVKIEDGCDNRCSYCIISTARGPVRSKPQELVISEVRALTDSGCREIILTGIETASYGMDFAERRPYGHYLADLIREIEKI
ncbi:MAG: radical SAM protein, partial [Clostridia bacterium]|nr:radical SAM protein [Clostridia bacterium]